MWSRVVFPETLHFGDSLQVIWESLDSVVTKVFPAHEVEDFLENQKLSEKRELFTEFLLRAEHSLHILPPLFLNTILRGISFYSNFNPGFEKVYRTLKVRQLRGGRTSICIQGI